MPSIPPGQVATLQAEINQITSKRMRILRAIKEVCKFISIDNGFKTDVNKVSFNVKGWDSDSEGNTPAIYIIDDTQVINRFAARTAEYKWTIRLFGSLRNIDIEAFEIFLTDIEQAFYDNNTLLGQVNKTEVTQISTDNQLFSEQEGTHLYETVLEVMYCRDARDAQ